MWIINEIITEIVTTIIKKVVKKENWYCIDKLTFQEKEKIKNAFPNSEIPTQQSILKKIKEHNIKTKHYFGSDGKYLGEGITDIECKKIFGLE